MKKLSRLPATLVLVATFALGGCAGSSLHAKFDPPDLHTISGGLRFDVALAEFELRARSASEGDGTDGPKLKRFIDSGIVASNIACDLWLVNLSHTDRQLDLGKDMMNIVANTFIGIAGLNGAGATSLARASLGLAGANAALDAFKSNVIQGIIPEIRVKLEQNRDIKVTAVESDYPDSYPEAQQWLVAFHRTCSGDEVRRLLRTSLQAVAYQAADESLSAPINRAVNAVAIAQLFLDVMAVRGTFTDEQLYRIWLSGVRVADEKDLPDYVKGDAFAKLAVEKLKALAKIPAEKPKYESALVTLERVASEHRFSARWEREQATAKKLAEAEVRTERLDKSKKNLLAAANAPVAGNPSEAVKTALEKAAADLRSLLAKGTQTPEDYVNAVAGLGTGVALREAAENYAVALRSPKKAPKKPKTSKQRGATEIGLSDKSRQ